MTIPIEESWMHQIRRLAPLIEKTEYEVFKCEAEVKKLQATLKLKALGDGVKTHSGQETWAESQDELYQSRLNPAEIHHTQGKTKPDAHLMVLPLCFEHHRKGGDKEPISRHPYKKRFEKAYGTEDELLRQVEELIEEQKGYGYLDDLPIE